MQEELYGPLKMSRSNVIWLSRFESDSANGYDEYGRSLGPERHTSPNAAGSIETTPRDYATFLSALIRGKLLHPATRNKMLSSQIRRTPRSVPVAQLGHDDCVRSRSAQLRRRLGIYKSPYGPAFFQRGARRWLAQPRTLLLERRRHAGDRRNSANGEGIFKPLVETFLGGPAFPFDWEGYTTYDKLPPPQLKNTNASR